MTVVSFKRKDDLGLDPPILVADDDPVQVAEISEYLERRGLRVIAAMDGEQAISAIVNYHPRVALVDVNMPGWDGLKVARVAGNLDYKLTILLMSGDEEALVRANQDHEGAFGVLEKPLAMRHVGHFIDAALLRSPAQ